MSRKKRNTDWRDGANERAIWSTPFNCLRCVVQADWMQESIGNLPLSLSGWR
jgi:hypothetical protein